MAQLGWRKINGRPTVLLLFLRCVFGGGGRERALIEIIFSVYTLQYVNTNNNLHPRLATNRFMTSTYHACHCVTLRYCTSIMIRQSVSPPPRRCKIYYFHITNSIHWQRYCQLILHMIFAKFPLNSIEMYTLLLTIHLFGHIFVNVDESKIETRNIKSYRLGSFSKSRSHCFP